MALISWFSALAALWLVGPVPSAPATPPVAPASAPVPTGSFESAAKGAVHTHDVATVLGAFVDRCDIEKRDLDKARCRAVGAYLRRTLPKQTFALNSEDPAAISVSDYDASVKGYHVSLAGCIACSAPVPVGRGGEPRFVTLKVPDKEKDGQPLAQAVSVSRNTFGFDSLAQAKRWLETERPHMRAEFLFQPQAVDAEWKFGSSEGVAVKLVGARILNRCTGRVLVSIPPSEHAAERANPDREPGCKRDTNGRATPAVPPEDLPVQLSKSAINEAMANIRTQIFACYQRFRSPGRLELTYVVTGAGNVQSVILGAAYAGTPTGLCVLEVAKDAHFPQFRLDHQKFTYPFFLRD